MRPSTRVLTLALAMLAPLGAAHAGGLKGSPSSMANQHAVAERERLEFLRTRREIQRLVDRGELVPVDGNVDFLVDRQVPHRFARPEVKVFLEHLAAEYRKATGTPLVVTSLIRPSTEQPRNAHPLSVHPVGMAVDLRVPRTKQARRWLERTLLAMEDDGVLDVTRERRPPHYHVAVFPQEYMASLPESERLPPLVAPALPVPTLVNTAADTAATIQPVAPPRTQDDAPLTAGAGVAMLLGAGVVARRRRR